MIKAAKRDEAVDVLLNKVRKSQGDYISAVGDVISLQSGLMTKSGKEADELVSATERLIMILGVVASFLTILFGWFITRSITDKKWPLAIPSPSSTSATWTKVPSQ